MSNFGEFIFKNIGEKKFKKSTQTDTQITLKGKKFLQPEDIKLIVDAFQKKHPDAHFVVTGLGVAGVHELGDSTKYEQRNLKSFSGELNFLSEEEYLDGRVREDTKFIQFFQINLSILKPNKNI